MEALTPELSLLFIICLFIFTIIGYNIGIPYGRKEGKKEGYEEGKEAALREVKLYREMLYYNPPVLVWKEWSKDSFITTILDCYTITLSYDKDRYQWVAYIKAINSDRIVLSYSSFEKDTVMENIYKAVKFLATAPIVNSKTIAELTL